MDRVKSAKQVRDTHLSVLGPDLGPIYHALQNEVTWLHAKWGEFRKLYAHSSERTDLLNDTAGFFFHIVQDVLWENTVLHIARLTDRPQSMGKQNLTINRLPGLITDASLMSSVHDLITTAAQRCEFAREWRNRHLAHRDLNLATKARRADPLPRVRREQVNGALSSLAAVLNRVEHHFFDSQVAFDHFLARDDAKALAYHLAVAARYDERQRERLSQGKALPEDLEPPPEV